MTCQDLYAALLHDCKVKRCPFQCFVCYSSSCDLQCDPLDIGVHLEEMNHPRPKCSIWYRCIVVQCKLHVYCVQNSVAAVSNAQAVYSTLQFAGYPACTLPKRKNFIASYTALKLQCTLFIQYTSVVHVVAVSTIALYHSLHIYSNVIAA